MGACCGTDTDSKTRTIENKELLVIEFGDSLAQWPNFYPEIGTREEFVKNIRVKGIGSKHISGFTPLAGIRLTFTNDK